jgi:hypothetical protein
MVHVFQINLNIILHVLIVCLNVILAMINLVALIAEIGRIVYCRIVIVKYHFTQILMNLSVYLVRINA